MRDGAPDEAMASSYRWDVLVQSWSPTGDLLAEDVPLVDGDSTWDVVGWKVHEQVDLVVPRYSEVGGRRFDWLPGSDTSHPLAKYGQTLTITIVVSSTVNEMEWVTELATVRIQSWQEEDSGDIRVRAVGLLQKAADDLLPVPESPEEGTTLVSEFARILPGSMSLHVYPGVEDLPTQPGTQWAGPKIDALYDIADALPARLRSGPDGSVRLLPTLPETPEVGVVYRDGEPAGQHGMPTLISAPRSDTREGVINSVTVLSQFASSTTGQQEAVVVEQTTEPFAVATYGRVSEVWSSEQVGSAEQAQKAGAERLASGLRPARTVEIVAAPDPRLEPDDAIAAQKDGIQMSGYVLAVSLDLLAAQPMRITMAVVSERAIDPEDQSSLRTWGQGIYGTEIFGY